MTGLQMTGLVILGFIGMFSYLGWILYLNFEYRISGRTTYLGIVAPFLLIGILLLILG